MAEMAVPRLTRLLGIVTHLEENGEATFDELARHFGVTAETIKHDIDTLWCAGLPGYGMTDLLDFDGFAYDEGIARLTNSQGVRQVRLAPAEAMALMGALAAMIASGTAPEAATGALAALSAAVADANPVTVIRATPVNPAVVEALRAGIERKLAVAVTYVDAQDRRTSRVIEPHRLVTVDGLGYVECYCRRAGDYRTLRLDRIEVAGPTDDAATALPRAASGFTLEPAYTATVRVARAGRWAFEDLPGAVLAVEGDEVVATFGVANPDVVVARLLAVAPSLSSVEPASLRQRLGEAASAVLSAS
jgi:proteasome accessory factor C